MQSGKSMKIASKVAGKIALGLLAVFLVLTLVLQLTIRSDLVRREQEKLTLLATENARVAREFMDSMYNKQTVLINTITNLDSVEDAQKAAALERIITETKAEESHALSLFFIAEPNAFLKDTPNGYAIFATSAGTKAVSDRYAYVNKELYEQVKKDKAMTVVDPFLKTIDGVEAMVITVVVPVLDSRGKFLGVAGSNIDTAVLNAANFNHGGFESFAMQILCGHQTVIANSKTPESIGQPYLTVTDSTNAQKILDTANGTSALTFLDKSTSGTQYYKSYVPFYLDGSSVVWLSGTSITKAEFDAQIFKQLVTLVFFLVAALCLLTVFAYFMIKQSLRPLHKLDVAIKALSEGNLHYQLDYTSSDEFGSLADSVRTSTATLYAYIKDIDRAMEEMAGGNFDLHPSQPFIGDFQNIEASISKFILTFSSVLLQIRMAAEQVSAGSTQVSDGAQALAQSATQQAHSVEVLSTEIAEIAAQSKTTAAHAADVNTLASVVGEKINVSNEQMTALGGAMTEINASSHQIGKIIKTIEDIAFQTNILALNAAVEAARAGSAGKGFAVVADEVRNLANKSSAAAKQTGTLIEGSVSSVQKGVQIAKETANSLSEVVVGASEITQLIAEISQASAVQTESIAEVTMGVEQISAVVQTNSATSEESAAASQQLSGQAEMMKSLVSQFNLGEQSALL